MEAIRIIPTVIPYSFSQSFQVTSQKAYEWSTDFTADDHTLMGEKETKRQVMHLSDNIIILKETLHTDSGDIAKQKLVHLYPNQLSWVSTHLTGPNKHSQFIYKMSAKDHNASYLSFNAHHIEYQKEFMTTEEIAFLKGKLCNYDLNVWKLLAKAMEKELNK